MSRLESRAHNAADATRPNPERMGQRIFMPPAGMHNRRQTNSPARRGVQQLLKTEQQFLAPGSVKLSIFKTILKKNKKEKKKLTKGIVLFM